MKTYKVAILGATGAVGQEMIKILMERSFPIRELHLLASARSAGKKLTIANKAVSYTHLFLNSSLKMISSFAAFASVLASAGIS